jgi:UDP-MurNAc hydroxylase
MKPPFLKLKGIELKYIYSACVITTTPDVRILHDPWFTEGIYDGSWFHFPKVTDPFESIGDVDLIYISHIHPDHYDPKFLKRYFDQFGIKEILIANHEPNYLARKIAGDDLKATILKKKIEIGMTSIEIFPHQTGSDSDIDSVLVLKYKDEYRTHCLVNTNDVVFDDLFRKKIKESAGEEIDLYLGSYTAAGPYPQTYFEENDPNLKRESERITDHCLKIYKENIDFFKAKKNLPFAGKYLLGSKASHLNFSLPAIDPISVKLFDNNAVILKDDGGFINTQDMVASGIRTNPYHQDAIIQRIDEVKLNKMDYEKLIDAKEIHQLPLKRLIHMAANKAIKKSEIAEDYYFYISLDEKEWAVININNTNTLPKVTFEKNIAKKRLPRSEIYIDPRYLFGLLTHIYHWNNAEVGSNYTTRRYPNKFDRRVQNFLNFFTL